MFANATKSTAQMYGQLANGGKIASSVMASVVSVRQPLAEVNARILRVMTTSTVPELLHKLVSPIVQNLEILFTLPRTGDVIKLVVSEIDLLTTVSFGNFLINGI